MFSPFYRSLYAFGIIPVVEIDDLNRAEVLAGTLIEAGLPLVEITLRTPVAVKAIQRIRETHPKILLGAGTILTLEQARQSVSAGADFLVSPGLPLDALEWALGEGIPFLPGAVTPHEILQGLRMGIEVFKFFPAETMGGVAAIKAISDPFPSIRFIPTGGIQTDNLAAYLTHERVLAVGGSWLAKRQWITSGQFDQIKAQVKAALRLVQSLSRPPLT
ncbi:MAG TPA: 2-dehydro-3-deoxyphosphogluconate aldolase [Anaerolineaceae bacterium]|nr:2-dehydro-3-deoxyphosphogluconate aldolase [Anaerolineaceae bacterium]